MIHRGAGAAICARDRPAHLARRRKGLPSSSLFAISGLFQCPTIVNNVETLACVPFILRHGAERFAALGTPQGGTRLFSVCAMSSGLALRGLGACDLRELIERYAEGHGGRKLKAVIPGGISAKVLTADEIDVGMDFDALMAAGTMAGSGGVIVMDETACMVEALQSATKFFAHESCGQCSPCREVPAGFTGSCAVSVRARDAFRTSTIACHRPRHGGKNDLCVRGRRSLAGPILH